MNLYYKQAVYPDNRKRQGLKVGCLEEIVYSKGFINKEELLNQLKNIKSPYSDYLQKSMRNDYIVWATIDTKRRNR